MRLHTLQLFVAVELVYGATIIAGASDERPISDASVKVETWTLRGEVIDAASQQSLPARVSVRSSTGTWNFPISASQQGPAIEYKRQVGPQSLEQHVTLSHWITVADTSPVNGNRIEGPVPDPQWITVDGTHGIVDETIKMDGSGWLAIRCFDSRPDHRIRFAHTAPVFVDVPGQIQAPFQDEVAYFVERIEREINRNRDVLIPDAFDEYVEALSIYRELQQRAIPRPATPNQN